MKPTFIPSIVAVLAVAGCAESSPEDAAPAREARAPLNDAPADVAPALESGILVSAEWLADRLDEPGLVILHVGPDRTAYDAGHIPGARYLSVDAYAVEAGGIANELPPVERLLDAFQRAGVSDDSRVVVYGPPLAAARAFFTLDYLGHGERTALLDGGLSAWRAEDRPVSTEPAPIATGRLTPRPQRERLVDADWVSERLGDPDVVLIDARPEAQFTGAEAGEGVPRPGHIPGAANVFWRQTIFSEDDPRLREPERLRELYRAAGARPGKTVVTYCLTGMQSSFAYFVARYLGYDAKLYDGSFMDWSRRENLPVER